MVQKMNGFRGIDEQADRELRSNKPAPVLILDASDNADTSAHSYWVTLDTTTDLRLAPAVL